MIKSNIIEIDKRNSKTMIYFSLLIYFRSCKNCSRI